jgi:hypothetical protein
MLHLQGKIGNVQYLFQNSKVIKHDFGYMLYISIQQQVANRNWELILFYVEIIFSYVVCAK